MENIIKLSLKQIEPKTTLDRLNSFARQDNKIKLAVSRAVNHTLQYMRSNISKEIRKTYYVKKEDLDNSIRMNKTKPNGIMSGSLYFSGSASLPLIQFGATQSKNFVSVRVLKANRKRKISSGGSNKIVQTAKGRAAVWLAKNQVLARVEDKQFPIMLWGPNFMAFFKRPHMIEELNSMAERHLQKRFEHELSYILTKQGVKK